MLEDSDQLREFLLQVYPSFTISHVAKRSGQRVVYFGRFSNRTGGEPKNCDKWGEVVLKISEAESRAAITYVQREVSVLSQINSPHYPKVYFSDLISIDPNTEETLEKMRFISIEEKVQGTVLTELMPQFKSEDKVRPFVKNILSVLKVLWNHPQRLVHRDLKPDNIIIGDDEHIYIIDLGILRESGVAGITNSFHSFGPCTPFYSSPEQAKNDKLNISFKSDMFAIGIIAYEMLSGANPFFDSEGDNYVDDVLERVCSYTPPSLAIFGVSEEFDLFIKKLISKEPYKRYRTPDLAIKCLI